MEPENAAETLKKNWATVVTALLCLALIISRVSQGHDIDWNHNVPQQPPRSQPSYPEQNQPPAPTEKPRTDSKDYHPDPARYRLQMQKPVEIKWQIDETKKQLSQASGSQRNRANNNGTGNLPSPGHLLNRQNNVSNGKPYSGTGQTGSRNHRANVAATPTTTASAAARRDPCAAILNNPPPLDAGLYSGTFSQWTQAWAFYERCLDRLRK